MKKTINLIITVLFITCMIILTITARKVHNNMIPNVKVSRFSIEQFNSSTDKGSQKNISTQECMAIKKKIYNQGEIFIISLEEKNDEMRAFVHKTKLVTGRESDKYYEVTNIYDPETKFVIESNQKLQDGDEVYIVN